MAKRSRTGWGVVLGGILATIGILAAGAFAYWEYANYVPPFRPQLPPMPYPNGYAIAARAVARLSQIHRPPLPRRWPEGKLPELQAQLSAVNPVLDQVRAAFRGNWRMPPILSEGAFVADVRTFSDLRECARCFAAESILSRTRGDYDGAMRSSMDAMELGCRCAQGSTLTTWTYPAEGCHYIGLREAERAVFSLPGAAIPGSLTRARRLETAWPALSEILKSERAFQRGSETTVFSELRRVPLTKKLEAVQSEARYSDRWEILKLALTPRSVVLANTDHYYVAQIAESEKPVRQRLPVPEPTDRWSGIFVYPIDLSEWAWRLQRPRTDLALLEVALAVRMHYFEHGRYPARLTDISKQWLPAVPVDLWDQPIAYRLKNGQPVIYSLGPDGKDDGGKPADPTDVTPATRGDLVFGALTHSRRQR